MLQRLKEQGITILVSTPYMDEATLCDRIALIQSGIIMSVNTPEGIVSSYPDKLYKIKAQNMIRLGQDLRKYPLINSSYSFGEFMHVTLKEGATSDNLKDYLIHSGHTNAEIFPDVPTVEDCFIQLMSEPHLENDGSNHNG